jgi:hypothetical protein
VSHSAGGLVYEESSAFASAVSRFFVAACGSDRGPLWQLDPAGEDPADAEEHGVDPVEQR